MTARKDLITQWQQRLQSWSASSLSQKEWCDKHDIKQSQFWYWKKKLEGVPASTPRNDRATSAFVPVALTQEVSSELTVSLPNGLTVSGIDQHNLTLAGQLIGVLR